ncbi:hypothetical protein SNEBB_000231 [Seison nebaliae]|nr:hypothetical protein SNEBB_000231 [Seison nebaliae]
MSSLIKNQIVKVLSRFTKNLSNDNINLSTIKGEGVLNNLELNEEVLMHLIELPLWLRISKAVCNKINIKIQWSKVHIVPIQIGLDEVTILMETCDDELRKADIDKTLEELKKNAQEPHAYAMADRIVDGIRVSINSVIVKLTALSFRASVEFNRINVVSTLPNWTTTDDIRKSRLKNSQLEQVLLFKEITWQTCRVEAKLTNNDMKEASSFGGTAPLKLIMNSCRIRITMKKSLTNCSLLGSRVAFLFDDLLWVITDSQLNSVVLAYDSLFSLIKKAAPVKQKAAKQKLTQTLPQSSKKNQSSNLDINNVICDFARNRSFLSWRNNSTLNSAANSSSSLKNGTNISPTTGGKKNMSTQQEMLILFEKYNVKEISVHLLFNTIELHICADQRASNNNLIEGGSIQIVIKELCVDYYPYHITGQSKLHWNDYCDLFDMRDDWTTKLFKDFQQQVQSSILHCESLGMKIDPILKLYFNYDQIHRDIIKDPMRKEESDKNNTNFFTYLDIPSLERTLRSIQLMESSVVCRMDNVIVYEVSTAQRNIESQPKCLFEVNSGKYNLPKAFNQMYIHYTDYYFPEGVNNISTPSSDIYVHINPVKITFDYLSIIWLNAFIHSTIHLLDNLSVGEEHLKKLPKKYLDHVHMRLEAIMPKLIFYVIDGNSNEKESSKKSSFIKYAGSDIVSPPIEGDRPTAMEISMSRLVLTNNLNDSMTSCDRISLLKAIQSVTNSQTIIPSSQNECGLKKMSPHVSRVIAQLFKRINRSDVGLYLANDCLIDDYWMIFDEMSIDQFNLSTNYPTDLEHFQQMGFSEIDRGKESVPLILSPFLLQLNYGELKYIHENPLTEASSFLTGIRHNLHIQMDKRQENAKNQTFPWLLPSCEKKELSGTVCEFPSLYSVQSFNDNQELIANNIVASPVTIASYTFPSSSNKQKANLFSVKLHYTIGTKYQKNEQKNFYYSFHPHLFRTDGNKDLWSIHAEQFWIDFTGIQSSMSTVFESSYHSKKTTVPFMEPVNCTLWSLTMTKSIKNENQKIISTSPHTNVMLIHFDEKEQVLQPNNLNDNETDKHQYVPLKKPIQLIINHFEMLFFNRLMEHFDLLKSQLVIDTNHINEHYQSTRINLKNKNNDTQKSTTSNSMVITQIPDIDLTILFGQSNPNEQVDINDHGDCLSNNSTMKNLVKVDDTTTLSVVPIRECKEQLNIVTRATSEDNSTAIQAEENEEEDFDDIFEHISPTQPTNEATAAWVQTTTNYTKRSEVETKQLTDFESDPPDLLIDDSCSMISDFPMIIDIDDNVSLLGRRKTMENQNLMSNNSSNARNLKDSAKLEVPISNCGKVKSDFEKFQSVTFHVRLLKCLIVGNEYLSRINIRIGDVSSEEVIDRNLFTDLKTLNKNLRTKIRLFDKEVNLDDAGIIIDMFSPIDKELLEKKFPYAPNPLIESGSIIVNLDHLSLHSMRMSTLLALSDFVEDDRITKVSPMLCSLQQLHIKMIPDTQSSNTIKLMKKMCQFKNQFIPLIYPDLVCHVQSLQVKRNENGELFITPLRKTPKYIQNVDGFLTESLNYRLTQMMEISGLRRSSLFNLTSNINRNNSNRANLLEIDNETINDLFNDKTEKINKEIINYLLNRLLNERDEARNDLKQLKNLIKKR